MCFNEFWIFVTYPSVVALHSATRLKYQNVYPTIWKIRKGQEKNVIWKLEDIDEELITIKNKKADFIAEAEDDQ